MENEINIKEFERPLRLSPDNWTENVWGGDWIPKLKNMPSGERRIGESWEFSGHSSHPSDLILSDGRRIPLVGALKKWGSKILGPRIHQAFQGEAPFLIKFIDARDNLSLQVHPPETYAQAHEKDHGKYESWIILDTVEHSDWASIYLGFDPHGPSTDSLASAFQKAFESANKMGPSNDSIALKKAADMVLPFINCFAVKKGDIFDVAPGTLHAIGRDVHLFEIQQSSGVTYRVWDWNRPDPKSVAAGKPAFRPLHVKNAMDVLDFTPHPPSHYQKKPMAKNESETVLLNNPSGGYAVSKIELSKEEEKVLSSNEDFHVLTVIEGAISISPHASPEPWMTVNTGNSVLIPAELKNYKITGQQPTNQIFKSFVPK